MSTKDSCFSKEKHQTFEGFSTSKNGTLQYDNLNLNNQNYGKRSETFEAGFKQSKSISSDFNKNEKQNYASNQESDLSKLSQTQIPSKSHLSLNQFNGDKNVQKQQWKKEGKNYSNATKSNNNSTLSLHISAYENNSIIASQKDESKKQNPDQKAWKNHMNLTSAIQSSFEFPRQQENSKNDPEIMQFKASQQLFNPNNQSDDKNDIQKIFDSNVVQKADFTNSITVNKMSKSSEQCIFCGWNRRTCWQNIRFYNIPREPGLKRIRWLQVFGNRPITHRDRVCSVHFRSGRPSNDPSHEDFVPHLYLSKEPPPEVMSYFEQAADKESDCAKILAADASVELISKETTKQDDENDKDCDRLLLPLLPKKSRNLRPAIMQRKRRQIKDEVLEDENVIQDSIGGSSSSRNIEDDEPPRLRKMIKPAPVVNHLPRHEPPQTYNYYNRQAISKSNLNQYRRITANINNALPPPLPSRTTTAIPLDRYFVQSTGIQAGQTLSIKRKSTVTSQSSIQVLPRYHHIPPRLHNIQDPKMIYSVVTPRNSNIKPLPPPTTTSISSSSYRSTATAVSAMHHHISQEEDLVNQQLRYIEMEEQAHRDEEELHMLEQEAEAVRLMHEQELMLQNHHQQILAAAAHQHHHEDGMLEYDDGEGNFEEYYDGGFEEYDEEDSDILSQHHHQSRT